MFKYSNLRFIRKVRHSYFKYNPGSLCFIIQPCPLCKCGKDNGNGLRRRYDQKEKEQTAHV